MMAIDLRSDTVTKPTDAMREAMARAEVGDAVYGEDPPVNRMEALVAEMLGKEAAVYVPSGTMGNLISVLSHCNRGDEMILGDQNHIFLYEQGGAAAVGGIQPRTVRNRPDGTQDLDEMAAAIRGDNEHYPITALIAVENTHNRCGGRAPVDYMDAVGNWPTPTASSCTWTARACGAAVALDVPPARVVQAADSVSVCLSKGWTRRWDRWLWAMPRSSGGRRMRKQVGGGMRQAGVLAAAGIVALTTMVDRLAGGPRMLAIGPRSGPSGRRRPGPGRGGDRHRLL
ncbi:MAG: GntG family PLP-dependent aldolase [Caldilineaceae bacterium]